MVSSKIYLRKKKSGDWLLHYGQKTEGSRDDYEIKEATVLAETVEGERITFTLKVGKEVFDLTADLAEGATALAFHTNDSVRITLEFKAEGKPGLDSFNKGVMWAGSYGTLLDPYGVKAVLDSLLEKLRREIQFIPPRV